jgi:protocatechuate 3,4-dioxygenase beta subunit
LLVIEEGQFNYGGYSGANGQLPTPDWPQNRPLAGAEPSGPSPIILAGQVLDDKSGQPLARFKILPGYKPPVSTAPAPAKPLLKGLVEPFTKKTIPWNEQPYWKLSQTETFSNGTFAVSFVPLSSSPILRIEADGYQSFETTPTNMTTSNIVVRLKTGAGPNGVVLLPDGKPAEGAAVFYAANKEGFSLEGRNLRSYDRNNGSVTTSKDGKFTFPTRAHGEMIFVAHPSGWAQESVESGGENLKLKLQAWAVVIGTLVDTNGRPMSGVELEVGMPNNWQRGDPRVYIPARATTDAQGRFQFVDVPPVRMDVNRIVRMTQNSWSSHPQTWFVAQPGTNDLGKVTYDRPPPPPMLEQLKKSIGL